ncbi:SDR family NAD(P)-dependent oxidoreductase [Rhodococcus qingshengii]|uniref:SDR family NAD(P)-dependent oxidoreductase n=1 Tax=Rhodococcus qingshengii TaxID=334542 RepID=UPI0010A5C501|nr:SDR family oxidoreductase [Rhodococcus qingshengii]THJ67687.1 SDR family oxidoreductase [Rhodococcus qingshengii]
MPRLENKVAIITGATWIEDGGLNIGGATAEEFASEGARVVVADINASGAIDLADRLNERFGKDTAIAVRVDVRVENDLEQLVAEAVSRFERLDIVVNNAGVFPGGDADVAGLEADVWDDVIAVNARGPMLLTKHALPVMLRQGSGSIVNTASTHAFAGDLRLTGYGASKAAVNALTVYTATQYGGQGVRCNAICPGTTLSPPAAKMPEIVQETYRKHTLNANLNKPADLARAFAFLASDDSAGINGSILRVDGGLLAHQPFAPDFAAM